MNASFHGRARGSVSSSTVCSVRRARRGQRSHVVVRLRSEPLDPFLHVGSRCAAVATATPQPSRDRNSRADIHSVLNTSQCPTSNQWRHNVITTACIIDNWAQSNYRRGS